MRALTIKQPFASAIFLLGKDVENRSWATSYRGRLAIHAGLRVSRDGDALSRALGSLLPLGAVIGVVELLDVIEDSASKWAASGGFHWLLRPVKLLAVPVLLRGRQGLFTLPSEAEQRVLDQL